MHDLLMISLDQPFIVSLKLRKKVERRGHRGTLVPLKGGVIGEPWFP